MSSKKDPDIVILTPVHDKQKVEMSGWKNAFEFEQKSGGRGRRRRSQMANEIDVTSRFPKRKTLVRKGNFLKWIKRMADAPDLVSVVNAKPEIKKKATAEAEERMKKKEHKKKMAGRVIVSKPSPKQMKQTWTKALKSQSPKASPQYRASKPKLPSNMRERKPKAAAVAPSSTSKPKCTAAMPREGDWKKAYQDIISPYSGKPKMVAKQDLVAENKIFSPKKKVRQPKRPVLPTLEPPVTNNDHQGAQKASLPAHKGSTAIQKDRPPKHEPLVADSIDHFTDDGDDDESPIEPTGRLLKTRLKPSMKDDDDEYLPIPPQVGSHTKVFASVGSSSEDEEFTPLSHFRASASYESGSSDFADDEESVPIGPNRGSFHRANGVDELKPVALVRSLVAVDSGKDEVSSPTDQIVQPAATIAAPVYDHAKKNPMNNHVFSSKKDTKKDYEQPSMPMTKYEQPSQKGPPACDESGNNSTTSSPFERESTRGSEDQRPLLQGQNTKKQLVLEFALPSDDGESTDRGLEVPVEIQSFDELSSVGSWPSIDSDDSYDTRMKKMMQRWVDVQGRYDDDDGMSSYDNDVDLEDNVLDHVVLAAPDLDEAIEQFEQMTGIKPTLVGPLQGLGARTAHVGLDNNRYIEILAPEGETPGQLGDELRDLESGTLTPWHYSIRSSEVSRLIEGYVYDVLGWDPDHIAMVQALPDKSTRQWDLLTMYGHDVGGCAPCYVKWKDPAQHPTANIALKATLTACTIRAPRNHDVHKLITGVGGITVIHGEPLLEVTFSTPKGTLTFSSDNPKGLVFPGYDGGRHISDTMPDLLPVSGGCSGDEDWADVGYDTNTESSSP